MLSRKVFSNQGEEKSSFSDIAAWGSSRRSTDGGEGRSSIIDAAASRTTTRISCYNDDHHDDEMEDDYDNSGVSNDAIHLLDWVRDPSNNGSVYPNNATTHTVREVLSLLSEEEKEGEEEFDSPHLLERPGIQPAIATYSLLLEVLGSSVEGGDDMTERVALRGAIISRVDFLANAMAAVDMNLEETYSSWRTACVLPALEGYESGEFDDESNDESTGPSISKRQKTSNAKMKKENVALKN
jgi:hypothetical protein